MALNIDELALTELAAANDDSPAALALVQNLVLAKCPADAVIASVMRRRQAQVSGA